MNEEEIKKSWSVLKCKTCGAELRLRDCEYCGEYRQRYGLTFGITYKSLYQCLFSERMRSDGFVLMFGRKYYYLDLDDLVRGNEKNTEKIPMNLIPNSYEQEG